MNIKEIVFPVDFSKQSIDACPYVAALAHRLATRSTLLHVVEGLPRGRSPLDRLYIADRDELRRREEQATSALAAFGQQYMPQVSCAIRVLVGDPSTCIVNYGAEEKGRMIVMPTRGFGPFRQMLLGSVTAKVLHDSRCPVITGPHLEAAIHPTRWFELRRIMCAVALDWETDDALREAAELAKHLEAELIVVHVVTPVEEGLLPLVEPGGPPISTEATRKAIQRTLDRIGVPARVLVSAGEPSRHVASAAKEHNVDLIVIGGGDGPELPGGLGSHGYAIVRRAPCPVLRV